MTPSPAKNVRVYHGASHHGEEHSLRHFGSFHASTYRITSGYTGAQSLRIFSEGDAAFILPNGRLRSLSANELLDEYCTVMAASPIKAYEAEIKQPLVLSDVWLDDPIGSGGMALFEDSGLNDDEQYQLWQIFKPFNQPIFPQYIFSIYGKKALKYIIKQVRSCTIGKQEFNKRKRRSLCIGEDFNKAKYQEAIWLDLTLKLRDWSLQNGYDAFSYINNEEGLGCTSYVALSSQSVKDTGQVYRFNREEYMDVLGSSYSLRATQAVDENRRIDAKDLLWGQYIPETFWQLQ